MYDTYTTNRPTVKYSDPITFLFCWSARSSPFQLSQFVVEHTLAIHSRGGRVLVHYIIYVYLLQWMHNNNIRQARTHYMIIILCACARDCGTQRADQLYILRSGSRATRSNTSRFLQRETLQMPYARFRLFRVVTKKKKLITCTQNNLPMPRRGRPDYDYTGRVIPSAKTYYKPRVENDVVITNARRTAFLFFFLIFLIFGGVF